MFNFFKTRKKGLQKSSFYWLFKHPLLGFAEYFIFLQNQGAFRGAACLQC
jgi:hypothetical protein